MHSSRIDQAHERIASLRAQVKEEVMTEVATEQRRARVRRVLARVGGCCLVYLAGMLLVAFVGAYGIARTGLVPVPVLSPRVAHERAPTRMVTPAHYADLARTLDGAAREAARNRPNDSMALALTEGELTALLRGAVVQSPDLPQEFRESVQVAIVGTALELYARLPALVRSPLSNSGDATTLLIRGTPRVGAGGTLALDIERAAIGALPVPSFLVGGLLKMALEDARLPLTIRSVMVQDGKLMLTVATPVRSGDL